MPLHAIVVLIPLLLAGQAAATTLQRFDLQSLTASAERVFHGSCIAAEGELMAWCETNDVALMAYSPLDQGSLLQDAVLKHIADLHDQKILRHEAWHVFCWLPRLCFLIDSENIF